MSKSTRGEIAVVRSYRALEALGAEWDVLAAPRLLPMLSHAWVLACAETLYREDDLHVVTVRVDGVLVAVAPMIVRRSAGVEHLGLIGSSFLFEPSGLLYDSDDSLRMLVRAIVGAGKPVVLSRIPSQSPIIPEFKAGHRLVIAKMVVGTLGVPISSDWDDYIAHLSSRRRYDMRRARRRAEEAGKLTVRVYSPRPEQVEEMFEAFVRIESSGWKARNGSSLSYRHHLRRFFLRYATRASQLGILRFSFLHIDEEPIAAQYSVEYLNRLWVLKIGYNEAWSRCSPGWQLLAETMHHAFDRKLESYEFLGSEEHWLHGWEAERTQLSTLACYPITLMGAYGLAADAVARVAALIASLS
jgi:CelD/BcsL family acetyltransferase involved in cellulose biosynthesis